MQNGYGYCFWLFDAGWLVGMDDYNLNPNVVHAVFGRMEWFSQEPKMQASAHGSCGIFTVFSGQNCEVRVFRVQKWSSVQLKPSGVWLSRKSHGV